MAAQPSNGYEYHSGLSTAGIIYNEAHIPHFSTHLGPNQNVPPFCLPQCRLRCPIRMCSSSDGITACQDDFCNTFYIGNPVVAGSYVLLRQPPRWLTGSHVVLVTDLASNPSQPVYHLVCAILEDQIPTAYTFYTYSSQDCYWNSHHERNMACLIVPESGVSSGSCAYWLTEMPRSVISYDTNAPRDRHRIFKPLGKKLFTAGVLAQPETKMKLGRVGNQLGIVAIDVSDADPRVILFRYQGNEFEPLAVLNLSIDVNLNCIAFNEQHQVLSCRVLPVPIRFQSFKSELFLWMDGRVVLWENNTNNAQQSRASVLSINAGYDITYGFAHVRTSVLPRNFLVRNI